MIAASFVGVAHNFILPWTRPSRGRCGLIVGMSQVWRKCSSCKRDILTNQAFYVCSVSTCQGRATNYAFCSVTCWDAHLPIERHRGSSAGAIERKAPSTPDAPEVRKVVASQTGKVAAPAVSAGAVNEDDILVVVTRVRKYVADKSGMNTSASAYEALSDKIRNLCDAAIQVARTDGRKTVMDRDF